MSMINLLPEDYLQRCAQQRANVLCLALFAVVIAGVVAAAAVSERQARRVNQAREQINQEYRQAGELIEQMQRLEAKKQQVIAKAQMAAELLERVPRSYLLASLTNALPKGASLSHVKLTTQQERIKLQSTSPAKFRTRATRRGVQTSKKAEPEPTKHALNVGLEVTGLAETDVQVAQFIAAMQANPLIESVELVFSEEGRVNDVVVRKFQVTMQLKNGAEVEIERVPTTVSTVRTHQVASADERNLQ
ncbi:MAG: PilN domain-containing protein [Planctomycetes bacterium]|nr:PilN domain-containing protein [Planctomycetota bacterium]